MQSGPSKKAETVVAAFLPQACREEVLGDLYERYVSPRQYAGDALRTVPMVILSRIRRTADLQVLLIQAFALYASFLGAAWLHDKVLLREPWGLMRLAIPAAIAMLGLILEDTYAKPGRPLSITFARGPLLGVGLALAWQGMLWIDHSDLAVPRMIALYGGAMSLLLSSAVRMLFPPATDQLQGANAPAVWLKQTAMLTAKSPRLIPSVKGIAGLVFLLLLLIAWQLLK